VGLEMQIIYRMQKTANLITTPCENKAVEHDHCFSTLCCFRFV